MATLDIFNDDAFGLISLSETMIDIPTPPAMLDNGLFSSQGITTLDVAIERQGSTLKLVPARPRGAPGEPVILGPRKLLKIPTFHLPQVGSILADEVQGIRAFGTESEVSQALALFRDKLAEAKQRNDLTIAYQRMGAIKGLIYDYDGVTPLLNVYDAFGQTQVVFSFDLDVTTTSVRDKIVQMKRLIEAALGGISAGSIVARVSPEFFDALTSHESTERAFELYQNGSVLRDDPRNTFSMAGVTFEEISGSVNGVDFIEAGSGYASPSTPGLFKTYFAPADYMETVNTVGLPYYVKQERMKFDRGIEFETQSNPLCLNKRPEATIKITIT